MTHYLVRHSTDDVRLHAEDGSEPLSTNWSDNPTINEIADQCAAEGPGGSLLGDDTLRAAFIDAVSGGIERRDLTIGQSKPWE